MRVERKSASDVRQKLAELKGETKEPKKRSAEEKVKELDEKHAEEKKKKRKKSSNDKEEEVGIDPEVAAVMGISGFGSSKKS